MLSDHIDELERKDALLGDVFAGAEEAIVGEEIDKGATETRRVTRLIRLPEVQHRVGLGRSTIYRWMAEGQFPKPVQLGGYAVAWAEDEVGLDFGPPGSDRLLVWS